MANGTIAFDTLQTSGQITGTAKSLDTDYLVSGSTKCWWRYNISDNTFSDSFNVSGGTDDGTGLFTVTIANDFSAGTAMAASAVGSTTHTGLRSIAIVSYAAGSVQCTTAYANGGGIDVDNSGVHICGSLA